MATSDAQICNLALSRVGVRKLIDALSDPGTEAKACNAVYALSRDTVLASYSWPFATRRSVLAELAVVERTDWAHVYALPADCLEPQAIVLAGDRNPQAGSRIAFEIEANDDASAPVILTDQEEAELLYTAGVTNPVLFPPHFSDALAWRIAEEIAYSLPVKPGLASQMRQGYELAIQRAKIAALVARQPDSEPDSASVTVRL